MKQGDVVPIRVRRYDNKQPGTQVDDSENIIAEVLAESMA
jgi:hypothetical protein